ncbi:acyl-CoA dehydrogenase family protein, partial [Microbulbifer agarilyticus]
MLLQNPGCALVARADQPASVLAAHVAGLVDAVRSHDPVLVYLDAGDPLRVLETAAAERPREWVEAVVEYHTGQGLGRRMGLRGFEGYVDFMRHRRAMELDIVASLDLPTLVVGVDADHRGAGPARLEQVRAFLAEQVAAGAFVPHVDTWLTRWDRDFTRELGRRGWLGMVVPTAYGGQGRTYLERFVVTEELLV